MRVCGGALKRRGVGFDSRQRLSAVSSVLPGDALSGRGPLPLHSQSL